LRRLPDSLSSSSSLGSGNSSPSSLEGLGPLTLLGPATGRPPSPASSVSEPTIAFDLAVARFFGATILRTVISSSVAFPLPFSIRRLIASSNVSILGLMRASNSSFFTTFITSSSTVGDRRGPLGFDCTPPCSRTTFLPS
ncbi:hypothetical protein BDN71DRAFT_1448013, partial [Pleurotus eryngii]